MSNDWDGGLLADLAPDLASRTFFFDECASTNDEARDLAAKGVPHGSLVLAEKQTKGRGRRGQAWVCPVGEGIACSLILRPVMAPALWSRHSLAAGLGVAEALEISSEVKWPNDIWVAGQKICGILVEATREAVIIGIGLNVNVRSFPSDLAFPATSLLLETGRMWSREEVLIALIERVMTRSRQIDQEFPSVIESWNTRCALRHKTVRCIVSGRAKQGVVEGVSPAGELLLRTPEGLEAILQADEIRLV